MMTAAFPPFGCIADDLTGAVDLAARFRTAGFRVHLGFQAPGVLVAPKADILIVGLKSRMKPVQTAAAESLAALDWLAGQGCTQFYIKYSSTFDCTGIGNIGPVIEAAMSHLSVNFTVACPALPSAGRTTLGGRHFVGGVPLSQTHMRHHPTTPMRNSYLVPVLQAQTGRRVGLLPHSTVSRSASSIRHGLDQLRENGYEIAVLDAVTDDDLNRIGTACTSARLTTGSSGLALALMRDRKRAETFMESAPKYLLETQYGMRAVLSGSCSEATNAQVTAAAQEYPLMHIDPLAISAGSDVVNEALSWASHHLADGPVVISSTAGRVAVDRIHDLLGARPAAAIIERTLAAIANGLARQGVRQMIIAGGETSGAVVDSLGIRTLELGPTIDSGVSWTFGKPAFLDGQNVALAVKPGNFGNPNLFSNAWNVLGPYLRGP